ncbi:MAG: ComEC/Rec2 family competence protein [Acidobacteriota bacterium]
MPIDRKLPNFNRYPMFWLGLSFAGGILISRAINLELWAPVTASIGLGLIAFIFRKREYAVYLVLVAFGAAGLASATIQSRPAAADRIKTIYDNDIVRSGDPVEVEGVLVGRPEASIDGSFLTMRAEILGLRGSEMAVTGNVRLFVPYARNDSAQLDLNYGSRIRVSCKLDRDEAFLNPGVIPKKEILDRQQIDATGAVKSSKLIEKLADESVFLPLAWVYDQRARLIDAFRANLSPRAAGVMIASLLGDKYFLDKETADLFRDGGTFHILVISGLHITIIGGLLLLLIRKITRDRRIQMLITVSALWAYTLAVGANVPVVRATLMFTVVLASYVIYRQVSLLNSLGICSIVLLVWRPSDLFEPSFQLTFISVAAIIVLAYPLVDAFNRIGTWTPNAATPFPPNVPLWLRRLCETIYWNGDAWEIESRRNVWSARIFKSPYFADRLLRGLQRTARYLFEGVLVSLIVQVSMLPLSVVYFHRVSVSSVILNLWVGVFIAVESVAAVVGALIARVSDLLAAPFFSLAEFADRLMLILPRMFADNGLASFRLPAYVGAGRAVYFLYALPLLILAIAAAKWKPFDLKLRSPWLKLAVLAPAMLTLAAFISIIVVHPFSSPRPDGRLHFDFLDVGQGDSALVTFPDGTTLLVDGGGRTNYKAANMADGEPFLPDSRGIGEAVVSEFLWYRGYSRIDHILATHADADHIQGLNDVAKNFSIGTAAFGRMPLADPEYAELAAVLNRRGIPIESVARGDHLTFGGVSIEVLNPNATGDPTAVSDNDHSVVLRISMGERAFLLTGDIERSAESELVAGGPIAADLIKVPHHGSRTSSTPDFVSAVSPQIAVISVGRTSPFGHPHKDVVDRWRAAGTEVMTTGERGTISVSTDGHDLELRRFQQ